LQQKALQLTAFLGIEGFRASTSWLSKFKNRYNIRFKTLSGESAEVDPVASEDYAKKLPVTLKEYTDGYTIDEITDFIITKIKDPQQLPEEIDEFEESIVAAPIPSYNKVMDYIGAIQSYAAESTESSRSLVDIENKGGKRKIRKFTTENGADNFEVILQKIIL
jgi:hypothetical protein